jgi:SAM-dependent methyltransferase
MVPPEIDTVISNSNMELVDGIWYSKSQTRVSYPEEGNSLSYQLEENSWWFRNRNKLIVELVHKYSSGKLFWDIGGGNGFVSKGLQNSGQQVVLVEPGPEGAVNARKRDIQHVICATLEQAGIAPNSIEAAGLFDVVEHIEDDTSFLKSIAASMVKGGIVYVTVPAYRFLWSKDDDYARHYRRYTLKSLRKALCDAGFEPVRQTYFYSVLIFPIFIARTLSQRIKNQKPEDVGTIEKAQSEHVSSGILNSIMDGLWALERGLIGWGIRIPFGASCLVAYRKKD